MIKCQVVVEAMDRLAPRYLAENWDNVGLLIGNPAQEITKILTCLDVTEKVIDKAKKLFNPNEKEEKEVFLQEEKKEAIKNFRKGQWILQESWEDTSL